MEANVVRRDAGRQVSSSTVVVKTEAADVTLTLTEDTELLARLDVSNIHTRTHTLSVLRQTQQAAGGVYYSEILSAAARIRKKLIR